MYAEAEKYGMIMSDEAVKASAAFQDSLTQLKGTLTGLKNEMIGSLLPSLTNLTSGLNEIMNGNPDQGILLMTDAVSGLLGSIEELLPTLLQLGGEILQALVTSIVDSLPMVIEVGVPIVMELLQAIISNLDLILDAALQLLDALMIGLEANSEQLAVVAVQLLGKLTIGLIRMLPQLMQIGVQLIMGLLQGLNDPGMMQQLIQAAVLCTEQLISTFIKSLPQILSAGVELVKGLWQGITGSLDWLKGKIKGWVGNVMNFIKNLFGIHSPSAVMRDEVGKNLMLGIGEGIDAYAGIPQEAIDKATASLTATAGMTYQVDYIHDQIAAAAPPTAMTYSVGGNGNPGNGGTPLETVISLLQIIAANSDRAIVLSDGTLLGWMNAALGQTAAASERGVAV
jgi:phage-related protein